MGDIERPERGGAPPSQGPPPAFWSNLCDKGDATALIDVAANVLWTYRMLGERVHAVASTLRERSKCLLMLFGANDVGSVVFYLSALAARHAVYLSPVGMQHPAAAALIERYCPEIIVGRSGVLPWPAAGDYDVSGQEQGYTIHRRRICNEIPPHDALALMLSTSASTGSPKSVRLSAVALAASAAQVVQALGLCADDRELLALPIHYVYGLSVLNSVLHAGASAALVRGTAADRAFWQSVAGSRVTVIPVVSQTLDYMRSLEIDARAFGGLRAITHSGDALDPGLLRWAREHLGGEQGVALYLMYGQTEACGRISVLPPDCIARRPGSVGRAVPGGRISIGAGNVVMYRGPGVMLGYANEREHLALGDVLDGTLNTGDLGYVDAEGFLYITGRLSRDCKIFGRRVNLDEVEADVRTHCAAAVVESRGIIVIFIEGTRPHPLVSAAQLARRFQLPPQSFRIELIERLPRSERGKIAYRALEGGQE